MIEDKIIITFCKKRGIPHNRKMIMAYRRLMKNAVKRARDGKRKTLMQRDF